MDLSQIRELLKVVAESGVAEVEIEEEGFRMVVRISPPPPPLYPPPYPAAYPAAYPTAYATAYPQPAYGPPPPAYPQAPPPAASAPVASPPAASTATAAAAPSPAPETAAPSLPEPVVVSNDFIVKAPIVGTFYRAPGPDSGPFVNVGDRVNPGDVLCIIEAMKLMNEIECDVAGTIKEILVQNSEPVDFEKPLFVIAKD